ncbi:glycosyltransferase [Flavobacteriaceae bacterium TP-CH-4]|uniref:Glycosyltransferase n=1 Tax=Pelagihabitans pacificus TaxID=2696054 RepID=A0A967EF68_9FLAO|nr:glycosyltransferase [Pelagihabitans pacificus]NHF61083.1 glycosyltransferase [Pelagihabitans pacificus]
MAVNQLKEGALLSYVVLAVSSLVGLLYTPYMLRMMGKNEYGLYALVASVIAYLTILDSGFGKAIVFEDKVVAELVSEIQFECDVFALPTLQDGSCNAIVEAIAFGLPVVSSDMPEIRVQCDPFVSILVDLHDVNVI